MLTGIDRRQLNLASFYNMMANRMKVNGNIKVSHVGRRERDAN